MPFIDIARAIFAYAPQSTDELAIEENDFLYVLEKGDDDWWKVKKKVDGDDDGPLGLVPQNYLEAVPSLPSQLGPEVDVDRSDIECADVVRLYRPDRGGVVVFG